MGDSPMLLVSNFRRLNRVWRSLFRRMVAPVVDESYIQHVPLFYGNVKLLALTVALGWTRTRSCNARDKRHLFFTWRSPDFSLLASSSSKR